MFPIIEPCILTNLFFVCIIQEVKVRAKQPTSDTFYKSVYYLTLAKKASKSTDYLFKGCSVGGGLERGRFDMKIGGFMIPAGEFSGIFFEIT